MLKRKIVVKTYTQLLVGGCVTLSRATLITHVWNGMIIVIVCVNVSLGGEFYKASDIYI